MNNLLPAFDNTIVDSQVIFRSLLKAMSEPGTVSSIPDSFFSESLSGSSLLATTWSIARTLFDHDTKVYLSETISNKDAVTSLRFQTDTTVTENSNEANFAILNLSDLATIAELTDRFNFGSLEAPHESCTVILQLQSFDISESQATEHQLTLSGPGIKSQRHLSIQGLTPETSQFLAGNHSFYPCGLDFILCDAKRFIALPRSTRIEVSHSKLGETSCM